MEFWNVDAMSPVSMKQRIKSLFFSFLVVGFSAAGAFSVLINVHDYPQTQQSMVDTRNGDRYRLSIPVFYLLNESASGLKYALTGDPKHYRYFPTQAFVMENRRALYADVIAQAVSGNWCAQLGLSRIYAEGYPHEPDMEEAIRWYALAHTRVSMERGEVHEYFISELMMFRQAFDFLISEEAWSRALVDAERYASIPLDCQNRSWSQDKPSA